MKRVFGLPVGWLLHVIGSDQLLEKGALAPRARDLADLPSTSTAGITGVTFHDLRGTLVTLRLLESWTTEEVAMSADHTLRDLAPLDTYPDRGAIAEAIAKWIGARLA